MSTRRILVVLGDPSLRQSLAEEIRRLEGHVTDEAGSMAAALGRMVEPLPDAVLIDADLPDGDGRELCRRLRRDGISCPVLILAGPGIAVAPEVGASDCLAKPFRLPVLLARLRALLRRHEQSDASNLRIGPWLFRPGAKLLLDGGGQARVRLTEKEAAILHFLHRAGDRVVGRDVLLGEVWGYNAAVTTHTLETHVYRLRRKIERDPARAEILITEPGGYRLVP